jgi:hypothetical protein
MSIPTLLYRKATFGRVPPETGPRFGPYSRALQRGTVGDGIDGRSREGRFLRRIEGELTAQLGDKPSFAHKLLVRRVSRMMLRLELFEQRLDAGELTEFDQKIYGALSNHVRLGLRELGLKSRGEKAPITLADKMAAKHAGASR